MSFTFDQARRELIAPSGLDPHVRRWASKRSRELARWVLSFEHQTLPEITTADVREVLAKSSHALGNMDKTLDTDRYINDANPPWAMSYLFHACIEQSTGHVPTWGEFFAFVTGPAERYWWAPVREASRRRRIDSLHAYKAATWRMATAWQSAIRTVYTLAALRHRHGLDARYHLFTHVELRIDGWLRRGSGDLHAWRLVMPSRYEARKRDPRELFGGAVTIHDLTVTGYGRGHVYLPTETALDTLARALRGQSTPPRRHDDPQMALPG